MPPSTIQIITELLAGQMPAPPPGDDDWEAIAVTAIVLGLAPLLHWQLEQLHLAPPPRAVAKLAITRQAHVTRNQAIAAQLGEVLAACHAHDVPVIVLKGALLAPLAYPSPGLRPMNDIDLLFQPADLPRAAHILESLGYHGKHKSADQGPGVTKHLSTYRRDGHLAGTPNPYLSPHSDRMIEPHGSLEESWFGLRADITPGVWARAVPVLLSNQPALRLSTTDLLLHLAIHATFHVIMGAAVFVQLVDIGRVIATWPAEIDWPALIDRAEATQSRPFVLAALTWAAALYHATIPVDTLTALQANCPPGLHRHIDSFTAEALFRRTQQPPLVTLPQRLRRGLADRRETARWAVSLGDKWRVWQTALNLHTTDTAALLLGRKLKSNA
jgi:hypothetical protein